jgi:hypothetical protein
MPLPVTPWAGYGWPTAKSLNLALYTCDGTATRPNGITFQCQGRLFLESFAGAASVPSSPAGTSTVISGTAPSARSFSFYDCAGYWNATSDGTPFSGNYYRYVPAVPGSDGDGTYAGGWTIICHILGVSSSSPTFTGSGADFPSAPGAHQAASGNGSGGSPFALDLVATRAGTITPAVWLADATSGAGVVYATATPSDLSAGGPYFWALWAAAGTASAASYGTPALPAPVTSWTSGSTMSSVLLNGSTGIAGPLNFLANPPVWRVHETLTTSISTSAPTAIPLGARGGGDADNYSGWSASGHAYTIQRPGLYLVHGRVAWASSTSGTSRMAGVAVNGTIYWGPGYYAVYNAGTISTKTQVFSLQAGDTIQLYGWQNTGSALDLDSGHPCLLMGAWLSASGVPAQAWTPPDPTFRWQSGTPGPNLPALAQQHLASDLGFLVQKPYLLGYQGTAQTGLANNSFNLVTMDTIAGIVHGDTGDNYSGWNASSHVYAAPASGWYMITGELCASVPTTTTNCMLGANFAAAASGGRAPGNLYVECQSVFPSQSAAATPAATLCGMTYLLAGETVAPYIDAENYTATTWSTVAHGTVSSGITGSHCEIVWVSE